MDKPDNTDAYSDSQKLALYYKELQDNNPSWRPGCPECRQARRGVQLMIKTNDGFQCILCKLTVNKYMKRIDYVSQTTSTRLSRTNEPASRPRAGD